MFVCGYYQIVSHQKIIIAFPKLKFFIKGDWALPLNLYIYKNKMDENKFLFSYEDFTYKNLPNFGTI